VVLAVAADCHQPLATVFFDRPVQPAPQVVVAEVAAAEDCHQQSTLHMD
jgi:hypothetical protein